MAIESQLEAARSADRGANALQDEYNDITAPPTANSAPGRGARNYHGDNNNNDSQNDNTGADETPTLPPTVAPPGSPPPDSDDKPNIPNDGPLILLPGLELEEPLTPQQALEKRYGVNVEEKDGQYHYYLQANGQRQDLFTTDASDAGLKEGDTKLANMVDEKVAQIEQEYGVKINRAGHDATARYIVTDSGAEDPQAGRVRHLGEDRDPTLGELAALDAAFANSLPSNIAADPNQRLEVNFLAHQSSFATAEFSRAENGNPSIYFYPEISEHPPTEEDVGLDEHGNRETSMEYIATHELAHHAQLSLDGADQATRGTYREDIGWKPVVDPDTNETSWAIKGEDGYQYLIGPGKDDERKPRFYRVNDTGEFLDADGNVVETDPEHPFSVPAGAYSYTLTEMQQHAAVKPTTTYFPTADEMFAENVATYRVDQQHRAQLAKESPVAYAVTQAYDQRQINAIYGTNDDGSPKFIRMPNGELRDNNDVNRQIVNDFESAARTTQP